jgi:FlaA1/EpsC-like NDP-sugar epimerase
MPISEPSGWARFLPLPVGQAADSRFASVHAGKSILITGAGGFIGSALVHAIAAAEPRRLVLLESSENSLFEIRRRLEMNFSRLIHEAVLGRSDDPLVLDDILGSFHVDVVYHAAAYKHVPLLETNPFAAVRNNAIGTYTLAQAALRHHVPQLVLISTDKAVNPRSILGVSKRIAELVVVSLSNSLCRMNAVRLANVIGSSGSVVPIFLQQIVDRAPVTVTDPRVTRRFLSLRETIDAILVSGRAECEGRILLPDLGEPVLIRDLARFLIGALGKDSGAGIPILFTGLRPGDKFSEELRFDSETTEAAIGGRLEVVKTPSLRVAELSDLIEQLACAVETRDLPRLLTILSSAVPEYVPSCLLTGAMTAGSGVQE